jgi:hypothetical protein
MHAVKPTLSGNLMNRTALMWYMNYHASTLAYSVLKGLLYVIGKTNSIACYVLAGVSDVFGAAILSIDYALYVASLNVSNGFWHIETGYRYASWKVTQNGTTATGPRPLYYGNWIVAAALGIVMRRSCLSSARRFLLFKNISRDSRQIRIIDDSNRYS